MRGQISEDKQRRINQLIPRVSEDFQKAANQGLIGHVSDMLTGGSFAVSQVCLEDAGHRLTEVRLALVEAYACLEWYRNAAPQAPKDMEAAWTAKFYADHTALLLYAAAEDVADFALNFLRKQAEFELYTTNPAVANKIRKKRVSSRAAKVGLFMKDKYPSHFLTGDIERLNTHRAWDRTMAYRNRWVHDKPPIIDGLGSYYDRRSRSEVEFKDGKIRVSIRGGVQPETTIDQLLRTELRAFKAIINLMDSLVQHVLDTKTELREKDRKMFPMIDFR